MVQKVTGWIQSRYQDRLDEIARRHANLRTATETIEVSLTELDDVDDGFPFARAMHWSEGGSVVLDSVEEAVQRAFYAVADGIEEIEDANDLDEPDLEFVEPIEEMYIDVSSPTNDDIGNMVAVRGRIRQSTDALTWSSARVYRCRRCLTVISTPIEVKPRHVVEGYEREPSECATESCPGGEYEEIVEDTEYRDYRHLIVEQQPGADGATPSKIPCWIFGSGRVAQEYPEGDRVTVVGVLRADTSGDQPEQYIDVYSVTTDEERESVELTEDDRDRVREMVSGMDNAWETAADNLAPSIYGSELAKRGLVSSMVGSGMEERGENNHVLLIGDPGTGKTDLAESVREVLPSARKASMTHSSDAGLTAAAVQESVAGSEEWVIRAGALSLASEGILTAEELDKADFDLSSLNDALESGEVPVNKAGQAATVQTDARLIATANPDGSQFNPRDELGGQLGFTADVIDRFSLIYPFRDEKGDTDRNEGIRDSIASRYLDDSQMDDKYDEYTRDIDIKDMRMWFAMAREQDVEMTREAVDEIGSAWMRIREDAGGVIDIDARRQASMMRMAMSLARLRLGDEVTREDADRAARHVSAMLGEWGYDITGEAETASSSTDDDGDGGGGGRRSLTDVERKNVSEMASNTDFDAEEIADIKGIEDALSDVRGVVASARSESSEEPADEESVGEYLARGPGDD